MSAQFIPVHLGMLCSNRDDHPAQQRVSTEKRILK